MREVKFRGLDNTGKWCYGYYWKDENGKHKITVINDNSICFQVNSETVGQYIEILGAYEGDILEGIEKDEYVNLMSRWRGVVKYNEEQGRVMVVDDTGEWCEVDDYDYDSIIGNIYENPELLEVV